MTDVGRACEEKNTRGRKVMGAGRKGVEGACGRDEGRGETGDGQGRNRSKHSRCTYLIRMPCELASLRERGSR